MRRFFYLPELLSATDIKPLQLGQALTVTDTIFHHWCRVLRAKQGECATFFDGYGGEYDVRLTDIQKKTAQVEVFAYREEDKDNPYRVHIALVMSRGERMDYALQKATELGVSSIQLLSSQHGEVTLKSHQVSKKMAHWQQVILAACEQCGLNRPPLLFSPISITDWLAGTSGEASEMLSHLVDTPYYQDIRPQLPCDNTEPLTPSLRLVLAVPSSDAEPATPAATPHQPILGHLTHFADRQTSQQPAHFTLLIGAEGGLSQQEVTLAMQRHFIPWQLGNRVLRTETAPVVALTTLQTLFSIIDK
ncbi:16S rRNA (uracil(1498)-N(3))-methyltransferase [Psychrobacter sp. I-STPA6b]|uniref:16S rRNA (uracil(1498)-N(3))-methyltransferase n=1 Tax=Psychrobacter sp. I-STPA6b TaxID=2585718 RepID=UPI001D0C9520|nr:16S rRNA (uracil(1498)-N(3))-methyltransferase [Psychrobacter sp. I-STPA6b]